MEVLNKSRYGNSHLEMRQNPITLAEHSGLFVFLSRKDFKRIKSCKKLKVFALRLMLCYIWATLESITGKTAGEQLNQASLTESLNQFKTNHENTIVIISMRLFWTLWILCVLLFCERVGSEKRITTLDQDQENQVSDLLKFHLQTLKVLFASFLVKMFSILLAFSKRIIQPERFSSQSAKPGLSLQVTKHFS